MGRDGLVKIADFGEMKVLETTLAKTMKGTGKYMAPEVGIDPNYGTEVDIYSVCATFYHLIRGVSHNKSILSYRPLTQDDIKIPEIVNVINYNLTVKPKNRMTATKILWYLYRNQTSEDVLEEEFNYEMELAVTGPSISLPIKSN